MAVLHLRLLSGIIAGHLGVEVAELGVDVLTVPVLRTAFAAFANAHAKASIARAWPVSERGGLLGHPDRAGRLGSLAGELSAASSDTAATLARNVHNFGYACLGRY